MAGQISCSDLAASCGVRPALQVGQIGPRLASRIEREPGADGDRPSGDRRAQARRDSVAEQQLVANFLLPAKIVLLGGEGVDEAHVAGQDVE